jgi:hypothetical protein
MVTELVTDARDFADHADRDDIEPADVALAAQNHANFQLAQPPPRDVCFDESTQHETLRIFLNLFHLHCRYSLLSTIGMPSAFHSYPTLPSGHVCPRRRAQQHAAAGARSHQSERAAARRSVCAHAAQLCGRTPERQRTGAGTRTGSCGLDGTMTRKLQIEQWLERDAPSFSNVCEGS